MPQARPMSYALELTLHQSGYAETIRRREKMGPVAFFSLCLLSCLIFNPSLQVPTLLGSGIEDKPCQTGWLFYQGLCYGFFPVKMTWSEAELECQYHHKGAHLASILTDAEGTKVARYITKSGFGDHVWIGLQDPRHYRHWRWSDGSLYSYKAWNTKEPNNDYGIEYCVELLNYREFKNWNDAPCDSKNGFICKYRP